MTDEKPGICTAENPCQMCSAWGRSADIDQAFADARDPKRKWPPTRRETDR